MKDFRLSKPWGRNCYLRSILFVFLGWVVASFFDTFYPAVIICLLFVFVIAVAASVFMFQDGWFEPDLEILDRSFLYIIAFCIGFCGLSLVNQKWYIFDDAFLLDLQTGQLLNSNTSKKYFYIVPKRVKIVKGAKEHLAFKLKSPQKGGYDVEYVWQSWFVKEHYSLNYQSLTKEVLNNVFFTNDTSLSLEELQSKVCMLLTDKGADFERCPLTIKSFSVNIE